MLCAEFEINLLIVEFWFFFCLDFCQLFRFVFFFHSVRIFTFGNSENCLENCDNDTYHNISKQFFRCGSFYKIYQASNGTFLVIKSSKPKLNFVNHDVYTVCKLNSNLSSGLVEGLVDPAGILQVSYRHLSWVCKKFAFDRKTLVLQTQVGFTIQKTYHKRNIFKNEF
jgi:hypothetical protein